MYFEILIDKVSCTIVAFNYSGQSVNQNDNLFRCSAIYYNQSYSDYELRYYEDTNR